MSFDGCALADTDADVDADTDVAVWLDMRGLY